MRLQIVNSKNATSLYVIKSIRVNGKNTSKVVEKLGTVAELSKLHADPIAWAKEYVAELNCKEKEMQRETIVKFSPQKQIPLDEQVAFNGGYLFLQKIYHQLGLNKICSQIKKNYKISYSLDDVLSRMIYTRILFPSSKRAALELSKKFIEQPTFDLQHMYRALEIIAKEHELIQASLYKNSLKVFPRNTKVLFYDCTNFFFEIEQEEGLKQYGYSKEHKPSPIVQMGLFMDANGIPLAMSINPGNTNEQTTLKPLEKQIIKDFELSQVIVCTDAGLASTANRRFNSISNRAFVTTQSVKKLKLFLKNWALDPNDWKLIGHSKTFHLSDIQQEISSECDPDILNRVYYKQRWIKEDGLEQRLVVTYSPKYALYQKHIRNRQIERAEKLINLGGAKVNKKKQNDFRRFVQSRAYTSDGETAEKTTFFLNQDLIEKEALYDGFYAVCTNLEDPIQDILKINQGRWEIEESFRIMKNQFKTRPVYLKRDDRIKAHFISCFISLLVYRLLEKKLADRYSSEELISGLKDLNFHMLKGEGFIPSYTRTAMIDDLHFAFGFRTDFQILGDREMKKIIKSTKS